MKCVKFRFRYNHRLPDDEEARCLDRLCHYLRTKMGCAYVQRTPATAGASTDVHRVLTLLPSILYDSLNEAVDDKCKLAADNDWFAMFELWCFDDVHVTTVDDMLLVDRREWDSLQTELAVLRSG